MLYNGKPPAWMDDLLIARDWNIPPWEVENAPLCWYERTKYTLIMENKRDEENAKRWQQKQ